MISPPAPTNLRQCGGGQFELLPDSGRTTSTSGGYLATTFVMQFTGSAACSMEPGFFGVDMIAADGSKLPIDTMPAGPAHEPLRVGAHQLVFGVVSWSVAPGRALPTHLTFTLGNNSSVLPASIPVADVKIPAHSSDHSPENAWQSTAYGLLTSVADAGSLASLTATIMAPATVRAPSVLRYTVTLTNPTTTSVPLVGCPQFDEQLSVVPLKTPITVGAHGPLNCSMMPRAISAGSSVTMQMELDSKGEIAGDGGLTWQVSDSENHTVSASGEIKVQ